MMLAVKLIVCLNFLTEHEGPVYTCELDDRCPGLVEYPIDEVLAGCGSHYLNNTVAYAVAFAFWNKVGKIKMFGIDFSLQRQFAFCRSRQSLCRVLVKQSYV